MLETRIVLLLKYGFVTTWIYNSLLPILLGLVQLTFQHTNVSIVHE